MAFFFLLLSLFAPLFADELIQPFPEIWPTDCLPCRPKETCVPRACYSTQADVSIDLMNPLYESGVITTTEGGVLTAEGLRVQAQKITYRRDMEADPPVFNIFCEGCLLFDYNEYVLVGEALYYDFITQTGYLIGGKTALFPWNIGGKEFLFDKGGGICVIDGYLTTSENEQHDVVIQASQIGLSRDKVLIAKDLNFRVKNIPFFWLPRIKFDLKNYGRSPFAVKFGWGGFLGSHLSFLYKFLTVGEFAATARLDAFFGHGIGVGIETAYDPACLPTKFFTRSYYAQDIAIFDPVRRDRYRFQGEYFDRISGFTLEGIYDVVSDGEMAADYQTKDFELYTAGRTQLQIRRQQESWIANLFTKVRVNDFQSVNQELPSFYLHLHPFTLPNTGIIFENTFKASYLDYVFSDDIDQEDFHAGRIACTPRAYRPFCFGPINGNVEAGFIGIAYTNGPNENSSGQALGDLGFFLNTHLSKSFEKIKHVVEPYAHYRLLTNPRVALDDHYIFTIQDGYDQLSLVRLGIKNSLLQKTPCSIERTFWLDIWTNIFFNTQTVREMIQKIYFNAEWRPFSRIFLYGETAWNLEHHLIDYYNSRVDWTLSENLAFGLEYRYRSQFDWRKADFYNFILEAARSEQELLDSPLSDRRHTLLFRIFYRPVPDWSFKFDLRSGRHSLIANTDVQAPYLEYQIEIATVIFQHWRFGFIYEKKEADDRFSISLKLDPGPPSKAKYCR